MYIITAKQSHIITAITTAKLELILYQTNNTNIRNNLVCQVIDYLEAHKNKLCLLVSSCLVIIIIVSTILFMVISDVDSSKV